MNSVIKIKPLGFPWDTLDPFLFCAHHADAYPRGNEQMGPMASLAGRNIGQDFTIKDGWRMYHGDVVPGFPSHPHRGFETVTIATEGFVDHSDSLGSSGRFGNGDVQWMTAGKGVQHSEMFPLVYDDKENPLEIFQIWLNLPKAKKFVDPHYAMLWAEDIPVVEIPDVKGNKTEVTLIAGELKGTSAPSPAPESWAMDPANDVAIWTIKMQPGAEWTIPSTPNSVNRVLYFYRGSTISIGENNVDNYHSVELNAEMETVLKNSDDEAYLLYLQGRPINEPVVQHGPFVMNSQEEILETFRDYQQTQFGGWPWPRHDQVHPRESKRFARYASGDEEIKT
jgi:redox-sensitive bicupin YhaK (pirin superfamily)